MCSLVMPTILTSLHSVASTISWARLLIADSFTSNEGAEKRTLHIVRKRRPGLSVSNVVLVHVELGKLPRQRRSKEYDITKAGSPWQVAVLDSEQHVFKYPLDLFTMNKNDCESTSDCSEYGQCQSNQCVCEGDRFGRQCEFSAPCPELTIDQRTFPFPNDEAWLWAGANNYIVLRNENDKFVLVYDKPVYVYDYGDGLVDIIMFLGRRWVVADTILFYNVSSGDSIFFNDLDELAEHLSDDFHGYFDGYKSSFVSAPMDVGEAHPVVMSTHDFFDIQSDLTVFPPSCPYQVPRLMVRHLLICSGSGRGKLH